MENRARPLRQLRWIGSSYDDFMRFPLPVHDVMGYAFHLVQAGDTPRNSKKLKGAQLGAVELIADYDGDTYRAVYTVRFAEVVYVLHAFKKKAKKGIATPRHDLELIQRRLRAAVADYEENDKQESKP